MLKSLKEKYHQLSPGAQNAYKAVSVILAIIGLLAFAGLFTESQFKIVSSFSVWALLLALIIVIVLENFTSEARKKNLISKEKINPLNPWIEMCLKGVAAILAYIGLLPIIHFLLLAISFGIFVVKIALEPREIHFVDSVTSPDGQKEAIAYMQDPGLSILEPVYLVNIQYPNKTKRLFVADTPCNRGFEVEWADNETVAINGKNFNINQGTRHEECPRGHY
jgi:hypothetical protein